MKKIALIFTMFIASALSSNAFVDNQHMTTEQYLVNTGYSSSMSVMVDLGKRDPYMEPFKMPNNLGMKMKKIYYYVSPGSYTDFDYWEHGVTFNQPNWRDF